MKKVLGVLAVAMMVVTLSVSPAYADRDHDHDKDRCKHDAPGCTDNDGNDPKNGTTGVPEPGSLALVAAGIAGIGALAFAMNRKRRLSD